MISTVDVGCFAKPLYEIIIKNLYQVQLDYNYRVEIHKVLPKLTYLDDEPFLFDLVDGQKILKITPAPQHDVSFNEKLQSDWELVTERIKTFNDEEIVTGKNLQPEGGSMLMREPYVMKCSCVNLT